MNAQVDNQKLSKLCCEYNVRRLSLFGSVARHESNPESDVDLLVEFEPGKAPSLAGLHRLKEKFAALFGTDRIDLATPSILRNPYRRRTILRDAKELYAA